MPQPDLRAPLRLATTIRPYDWGSVTALPELFGTEPTGQPQAELWMGAHPGAPSTVGGVPLDAVIAADPAAALGPATAGRFGGRLPYLLKVLAVARPLSLQVHPSAEQARAGFAAENARGVPLDARERTYKDDSHKPEMVCALTPFHGLCGFRSPAATAALLDRLGVPGLRPWIETLRGEEPGAALRAVFAQMLDDAAAPLREQVERALLAAAAEPELAPYAEVARACPGDRGVTAALLLHHVDLAPGEALYLGAGVPHAYLGGVGVEIMANSDNVLRCGLTGKHVDVPELMRVVAFTPGEPHRVPAEPGGPGESRYLPPAPEFALARHELAGERAHELPGGVPQIVVCVEGEARLGGLTLRPGESAFLAAEVSSARLEGKGTAYRAAPGA
ncbi:mannose-6-phosphate isomerase, class I [Actinomadura sp. ATCC 31491]|uniref:mannose-6-phosphate isomerase n=1 Tax=Actinomadura luzonensis TaxID=2805427 RepID=A0ABT0FV74_9ACTN|nr:mannose-6-phosphate isomerase, class I [Actinomadura luzonensis]MCK2215880.1 mannose-6-phosphate isomerase, class I [Actinomadura luzonensis]